MGSGSWTTSAYNCSIRDMGFTSAADISTSSTQTFYKQKKIANELNPKGVIRECRDSEEHPNTIPIILALDVTGSMGKAARTCAAKLDDIMTDLYKDIVDVEFLMMGIGDLYYDKVPIQASQFESDIRILDQTSKIYFEGGGGPNGWESYTSAWYFGLYNTDLDIWKRGRKGIIITLGDEPLNPYLDYRNLNNSLGCAVQSDIETGPLYKDASEKFDIYHINILDSDSGRGTIKDVKASWKKVLGENYFEGECKDLPQLIGQIVRKSIGSIGTAAMSEEGITW